MKNSINILAAKLNTIVKGIIFIGNSEKAVRKLAKTKKKQNARKSQKEKNEKNHTALFEKSKIGNKIDNYHLLLTACKKNDVYMTVMTELVEMFA